MNDDDQERRLQRLERLFWLADAPLFIDERLVERFFDAVVRPKYEHVLSVEELEQETEDKLIGALGLEGKAGLKLPEWLKPIKLETAAKGEITGEKTEFERTASTSQLKPIWNAERQLEELARHYLVNYRDRIILDDGPLDDSNWPADRTWYSKNSGISKRLPRPILFLDLNPGIKLLPMAAEFADGSVSLLYEDLTQRLTHENGGPVRKFPDDSKENYDEERKAYWSSFDKFFDSEKAMLVVENASTTHGRINWIDFRLPLSTAGDTLHLHITPAGNVDAGVFGYNFVRRGYKHGIRLVGTLKAGLDMNVLAIYDR